MTRTRLGIHKVGQIQQADISFADLTVLVGPQATGKSILLQLFKLVIDTGVIQASLTQYGRDWGGQVGDFLEAYLGEGMKNIWRPQQSSISFEGKQVDLPALVRRKQRSKKEHMFFIPAQRVLTLRDGWPRPFSDYGPGDPFAVREFSDKLRRLMELEFSANEQLFPPSGRLKPDIRKQLEKNIFSGYGLKVDKYRSQKRLVMGSGDKSEPLPYMVWSAGQREFVPLLLGLYWLLPKGFVPRRKDVEWVVIEEPEMGLHPKAISTVLFMVLDLLSRGYRVCLSTHSPHILDVVWALNIIKEHGGQPDLLLDLFQTGKGQSMIEWAKGILKKETSVYYFDRDSGTTTDISALDPGSDTGAEAGWGGLSEFSGRAADIVAKVMAGVNP